MFRFRNRKPKATGQTFKRCFAVYLLAVSFFFSNALAGLGQEKTSTPEEALKQAVDKIRLENQTSEILMQLIDSKKRIRERRLTFYQKIEGPELNSEKTLIRFTAPVNVAGVALLSWDDSDGKSEQWLYLSDLKRITRISPTQLGDSFVGTDFNYVDMKYERFKKNTYTWQWLPNPEDETVIIKATPSEDERSNTGYPYRLITLHGSSRLITQIQFFDLSGNESKVLRFSDYRQLKEKWVPYQMEMEDFKRKHTTRLIFLKRDIQPLENRLFSQDHLENG